MQGYDIYQYAAAIPGRYDDPQPIIFAYITLNLTTLADSGVIAPGGDEAAAAAAAAVTTAAGQPAPAAAAAAAVPSPAAAPQAPSAADVRAAVQQAMSEQQKVELKGHLKDIMSRLMHREQSSGAMRELYVLRRCVWRPVVCCARRLAGRHAGGRLHQTFQRSAGDLCLSWRRRACRPDSNESGARRMPRVMPLSVPCLPFLPSQQRVPSLCGAVHREHLRHVQELH